MLDIMIFLPVIIIIIITFVAVPLINMFKNTFGDSEQQKKKPQDARYSRQVHQMHVKDAAGERQHYLDQLKSLYEAGMMEKEEYNERVAAIEADYRGKY
ncbi:MAG: hypothetical protein IJO01_04465 [Oscillospiraceae bacterium]|nr:hypothetical protein [Oscillospiraceae bacterium]